MKTSLDCIPCFVRQVLSAARMVSADPAVHEGIVREVLLWVGEMTFEEPPPVLAQRILYLTDNAGEIAFDRLLIEQLSPTRVTVAVRGAPVITDATMSDVRAVGLHEIAEIIDNGSDAPGTLLDDCSQEFRRRFTEADLILAKGQGNFEALSDTPGNIIFLFMAKCPVIATHAGVPIGAHVLARSNAGNSG